MQLTRFSKKVVAFPLDCPPVASKIFVEITGVDLQSDMREYIDVKYLCGAIFSRDDYRIKLIDAMGFETGVVASGNFHEELAFELATYLNDLDINYHSVYVSIDGFGYSMITSDEYRQYFLSR